MAYPPSRSLPLLYLDRFSEKIFHNRSTNSAAFCAQVNVFTSPFSSIQLKSVTLFLLQGSQLITINGLDFSQFGNPYTLSCSFSVESLLFCVFVVCEGGGINNICVADMMDIDHSQIYLIPTRKMRKILDQQIGNMAKAQPSFW